MKISEKDKKIVAAVFATKGVFPHDEDEKMSQIIMAKREFDGYSVGEFQGGNSVRTNEYWEYICTIEEYNQCVEDMARAEWMRSNPFENYGHYKESCKRQGIDTSNKELLKGDSLVDKPLVYTEKAREDIVASFSAWLVNNHENLIDGGEGTIIELGSKFLDFSSKTPEQLAKEKKDAQLTEIHNIARDACLPVCDKQVKLVVQFLQDKNLLVEGDSV